MKRLIFAALAVSTLALAACGGGGGGTSGSPLPITTSAPQEYTAKLVFTGALAGHTMQDDLRRAQSVALDAGTATPIPIMVVSSIQSGMDTSAYGGIVEAVVSPMPSALPQTTFAQTNTAAVLQTPTPGQSPPSGAVAAADVFGANTPETQSAGEATATIGAPVLQSPSTPVYSYYSIDLECQYPGPNSQPGAAFGWQYNGTTWVADNDPTTADIYVDGPNCTTPGTVNTSEPNATIHIPGGDVRFSTDTPFTALSASQWSSSETSFDMMAVNQLNPDGSINGEILGKTRDGSHIFKLFPNGYGAVSPDYFGAIEVSGAGVDGF